MAANTRYFATAKHPSLTPGREITGASAKSLRNMLRLGMAVAQDSPGTSVEAQTASYTLLEDDAGKLVRMNVAGANTLTVPPNADVAFPVGTVVEVEQAGAGRTTLTPGAGVTINSAVGLITSAQYSVARLTKVDTNTWTASGDLAAV